MEKYLPAVCYHPTTVVIVDDNRKFLESLQLELDPKQACYCAFDDSTKALEYLTKEYRFDPFPNRCLLHPVEEQLEHRTVDIDVRAIHNEANNKKRFAEISVLVIDYAMPNLNGFDLCQKLQKKPFKKILLTCEADESLAIKAFNSGIIDMFIRKNSPDFAATINNAIHDLQKKYFHELSKLIINCLITNYEYKSEFLTDAGFIDFFEEVFTDLNMSEYYLMDSLGSFMFLDYQGKAKWLVVKNEAEMQGLTEFAVNENAPKKIISALTKRSHIPYFHTDDELQTPPANWWKYMHPAKVLKHDAVYYYAIISDAKAYSIDGKILSFADYCKKNKVK